LVTIKSTQLAFRRILQMFAYLFIYWLSGYGDTSSRDT